MSKAEVSNELSVVERGSLEDLEKVIECGIESFQAAGSALKKIRDDKLYREDHKTFESYLKTKWGFDRSYAHRLIEASDIKKDLLPVGNKVPRASEINTERQLRELKNVPDDQLEEVVTRAAEIAGDDLITSSDIKEAREQVFSEPEETQYEDAEPVEEDKTPAALQCVPWFKDQLRLVNELKRNLDQVQESPGTELILSRQRTILREIEHVKGGFLAAMPHAICPRCNGKCCAQCGNMGWVNKQRFDELGGSDVKEIEKVVRKATCKEVSSAAKLFMMMQKQHFSGKTGLPQTIDAMAEANGGKGDQYVIADASLETFLKATKLMRDGKK